MPPIAEKYKDLDVLTRLRTFDPPPHGFDPQTASKKDLLQHGFPRRPDPVAEPQLYRLWERVFRRVPDVHLVKANLEVDSRMSDRPSLREPQTEDFTPEGWGGVVVNTASLGFSPYEQAQTVLDRKSVV